MRTTVEAVLFDADGVVQTSASVVDAIIGILGCELADAEAFLHEMWRREEELGCLVGDGDLLAGLDVMLAARGLSLDAVTFFVNLLVATIVPVGAVLELVDQVRHSGVFCGLATNQIRPRLAFMCDDLGLQAELVADPADVHGFLEHHGLLAV